MKIQYLGFIPAIITLVIIVWGVGWKETIKIIGVILLVLSFFFWGALVVSGLGWALS